MLNNNINICYTLKINIINYICKRPLAKYHLEHLTGTLLFCKLQIELNYTSAYSLAEPKFETMAST
jgi:hypothetical protein